MGFSFAGGGFTFGPAMDSKELAQQCRALADDKKAEDIVILDMRKLPGVTDFMVICTGTSDPHLRAVEEEVTRRLLEGHGIRPRTVDGTRQSGWIVLDYVDVLVHVMKREVRERYDLEGLWNDAPRLRAGAVEDPAVPGKAPKKAAKKAVKKAAKKAVAKKTAPKKAAKKAVRKAKGADDAG